MSPELLVAGVMVAALVLYTVTGGADFGGGVWDLLAGGPRKHEQRRLIDDAIGPIWEANHVWLILLVVLFFVCFPGAFAAVCTATAIGIMVIAQVIGPKKTTPVKLMPYESGMDPVHSARQRFSIGFYLLAIEFLVFDVEILVLYPWAVAQWSVGAPLVDVSAAVAAAPAEPGAAAATTVGIPSEFRAVALVEILLFIVILFAAFAYAWRKGVFEWK